MLCLTRAVGESFVVIARGLVARGKVTRSGNKVQIQFEAPKEVLIVREELLEDWKRKGKIPPAVDLPTPPPIGLDASATKAG